MSITPLSPEEVLAFRNARGWTQKQAAEALGVVKRSWESWETRKVDAADPAKGAPPLYLRYAFAAIDAGLAPWPQVHAVEIQALDVDAEFRDAVPVAPVKKVSVGEMLSLPKGAKLRG